MVDIGEDILNLIDRDTALQFRILPFELKSNHLTAYIDENDKNNKSLKDLEVLTGKSISFQPIPSDIIDGLLAKYYSGKRDHRQQLTYYEGNPDQFFYNLVSEALVLQSSDIHVEIYEGQCRVRVRIDGMLITRYLLDKKQYPLLINKIKISANLDIAEKRLPQDGRILFQADDIKLDIRVSALPTLYGEKVVLRLLKNNAVNLRLDELGLERNAYESYIEGIRRPNGILLISGPTGSGKTTTLYATLKELNRESRNILTIEDPIEYTLEGINQVQLRENIGLSFAAALKTFLRQDPDIIMLGEIRDVDTANMAIRAALTGHLVLSTIHTNSAWGIVARLIDMGIAPYLLASTLNTAVAQRLLRKLCTVCKTKEIFNCQLYPRQFIPPRHIEWHCTPRGCEKCFNTGYKGRQAVYEVITIDEILSDYIKSNNLKADKVFEEKNIKSLSQNAFDLFATGETSLDEVYSLLIN